jgi:uncharacterized protein YndB with AHSA1/START domain
VPWAIRSDRRYRFGVPPEDLWHALGRTGDYRRWWPWLRRLDDAAFEAGAVWRCEVQPPLPYSVRFELHLEEVEAPRFITATVHGDITGHAAIDVHPAVEGSELRLVAMLAPGSSVLRSIARIAPPVVRFGHDWVIDTGLRQFRRRALPEG